jgi:hypothetical protein
MSQKNIIGQQTKIQLDTALNFQDAKDIAKKKMKEFSKDSMLLSWCNNKTGEYYPTSKCGSSDKPAWIIWAESRGGDYTVDINDGEWLFIFLSLS